MDRDTAWCVLQDYVRDLNESGERLYEYVAVVSRDCPTTMLYANARCVRIDDWYGVITEQFGEILIHVNDGDIVELKKVKNNPKQII